MSESAHARLAVTLAVTAAFWVAVLDGPATAAGVMICTLVNTDSQVEYIGNLREPKSSSTTSTWSYSRRFERTVNSNFGEHFESDPETCRVYPSAEKAEAAQGAQRNAIYKQLQPYQLVRVDIF